jgi:hypothetical protein
MSIAFCGLLALLGSAGTATAATFEAHGSVEQVYAIGLAPGAQVVLFRKGKKLASKPADEQGGVLFR